MNEKDLFTGKDLFTEEEKQLIRAWRIADERARKLVAHALSYNSNFSYTPKGKEGILIKFTGLEER